MGRQKKNDWQRQSECEGGFHITAMNIVAGEAARIFVNGKISGRDRDVVSHNKLVEDLIQLVVIIINLWRLTSGEAEGVAFQENIIPLKSYVPAMDVIVRIVRIRHGPATTD